MGVSVEMDEADKKRLDPFHVSNKKDGFTYRLLNKNQRNLDRRIAEGYEIVQGNDPERLTNVGVSTPMKKGSDLDTTRQLNDTVLARLPKELHEKKKKRVREATERQTAMARSQFRQEAGSSSFEGEGGGGWSGSMSESQFEAANSKTK